MKKKITCIGENVEKLELLDIAGRYVKWYIAFVEIGMIVSQKTECGITI